MNTSRYNYFISGRWRNRDAILDLVEKIRARGYSVYCFLEEGHTQEQRDADPEETMAAFEKRDWRDDAYVKEIFEKDMAGEKASENFILLLPAGKSCHIEAGVAYGLGKKCILIGETTEAESLYLIFDESYNTPAAFLATLP